MTQDVAWESSHGIWGWRPFPGVRVVHTEDGHVIEANMRRDTVPLLPEILRACAERWGFPVRCDRIQLEHMRTPIKTPRYYARIRRALVALPRYVNTPHGPEIYGYVLTLPQGEVYLDDAGIPDPIQLQSVGLLGAWESGPFDVICGDHPHAPVAEGDRADRFERFPERNRWIKELRAWPGSGRAIVTRHINREVTHG